jgi:NAD(P)-dependent dehydrogenase (short-subunit alcohol dehydrogenase family)
VQDFEGRVAVVTGAASGMGFAFAERFAREGMRVVLADLDSSRLDDAVADLRAQDHDVVGVVTDVSSAESVAQLAQEASKAFGKIHIVCNNAGVDGYLDAPIWAATRTDWEWTFGVNFWSVVHGIRTFVPLLLEHQEPAHIVNTASTTGLVHASNMYGITKHAVVALSEVVSAQLKQMQSNVGVSVLCPGIVNTRLFDASHTRPIDETPTGATMRENLRQRLAQAIPPAQVADVLLQAIRDDQFFVLTDHDWDDRIRARSAAVLGRSAPNLAARVR